MHQTKLSINLRTFRRKRKKNQFQHSKQEQILYVDDDVNRALCNYKMNLNVYSV